MRIEATATETRTVTLTPESAKEVACDVIREACKLPPGAYVDGNGVLCVERREGGGGHSWFETEKLRKATVDDRSALLVLKLIQTAQ